MLHRRAGRRLLHRRLFERGRDEERRATVTHSGRGTDPARQEAPHPHQALVTPDGKFVLVCDLGLDRVFVYDHDLTPVSYTDVPKGQGVRHLTVAPDGRRVYAVNELGCSITEFDYADGRLTALRTTALLRGQELRGRHPSVGGRRTAVRLLRATTSSPSATDPDGPVLLRRFCGGCWPRDFAVCGER
ncbi:MAG: lactonase family protein [Acutalibacteraceae bacterium]